MNSANPSPSSVKPSPRPLPAYRERESAAGKSTPTRERIWQLQHKFAPYLFIAPFFILFCCFMIYPLARSVILSLYKTAGPDQLRFIGVDNYKFLLHDRMFWYAVLNTTYFAGMFLTLQIPMSLGLAIALNSPKMRLRNVFRFSFFSAHLVGSVFVAIIFNILLAQRHGLVNKAIGIIFPFIGSETNWSGRPELAMPAVVIAALWISVGYAMVYFLAALQSVDRDLYEAAEVDGAGHWARFWHITLPGIRPVLMYLILVGTIGAYQLFELPYLLFYRATTNYGVTIVIYLFQMGFETGDIGYASAIGWVLVFLILSISLVQLRIAKWLEQRA